MWKRGAEATLSTPTSSRPFSLWSQRASFTSVKLQRSSRQQHPATRSLWGEREGEREVGAELGRIRQRGGWQCEHRTRLRRQWRRQRCSVLHNRARGCWKERERERASWQRSPHHHDTWGCLAAAGEHRVMQRRESRTSWKPKASRGTRSVTVKGASCTQISSGLHFPIRIPLLGFLIFSLCGEVWCSKWHQDSLRDRHRDKNLQHCLWHENTWRFYAVRSTLPIPDRGVFTVFSFRERLNTGDGREKGEREITRRNSQDVEMKMR